ncbi:GFA family protein [Marivita sp. S0852]|uniref:GFA family protein n=1 Tax=Marivita sp. S0852 TaxID=3373893 RepID=UPI0039826DE2
MPMMTGSCLCKACTFSATPKDMQAGACHCDMCRKWSGGVNIAVECTDVTWNADAPLKRFKSSAWAERMFCGTCGSNLSYHMLDAADTDQILSFGAFDEPDKLPVTTEIFIDEKPASYDLAGISKSMTGAEVFAMYAPGGEAT